LSRLSGFCLNKVCDPAEEIDVGTLSLRGLSMLVLKRATCLLLSFVLVYSPSLALARNGVKASRFKAQDKAEYNRSVEKHSKKTKRKQFAAAPRAAKSTKSNPIETAGDEIYRPIRIRGKDYVYSQFPGKNGRVQAQMIAGRDFQEILVDEFGTGTASTWKVARRNVEVTASHPYKGSFTQIDVRERRAKAFVNVRLQLNPDFKTYRMVASSIDPYEVDHQVSAPDSGSVHIMCENQVRSNLEGIRGIKDILQNFGEEHGARESGLSCLINRYSNLFFDKSCSTGEFAGSTESMSAGIAKIFSSVHVRSNKTSDVFPKGRSQYLQCLNDLGFAGYAAQAQTTYAKMIGDARNDVQKVTHRPASVAAEDVSKNSCEPLDQVFVYRDGSSEVAARASLSTLLHGSGSVKKFTCNASLTNDGEYKQESDQIAFKLNKNLAAGHYKTDAATAYASIAFHEILHKSGLAERTSEEYVSNLQQCCASPNPDTEESLKACRSVNRRLNRVRSLSQKETQLSLDVPGYAELRAGLAPYYQNEVQAQEAMGEWYEAIQKDPRGGPALDALKSCLDAPGAKEASCKNKYDGSIRDFTRRFFREKATSDGFNEKDAKNLSDRLAEVIDARGASRTAVHNLNQRSGGIQFTEPSAADEAEFKRAVASASEIPGLRVEQAPEVDEIVVTAPRRTSTASAKAGNTSSSTVININSSPTTTTNTTNTTVSQPPVTLGGATNPNNQPATTDPKAAAQDAKQDMRDGIGNESTSEQVGNGQGSATGTSNGSVGNTSSSMANGNSGSLSKGQTSKTSLNASSVPMPAQSPNGSGAIDPTGAQPLVVGQSDGTTPTRYQSAAALAGFAENLAGSVASSAASSMPTLATYVAPAQAQRLPASESPSSRSSRGGSSRTLAASTRGSSGSQEGGEGSDGSKAEREQRPEDQQQAPKENQESEAPATLAVRPDARSATDLAANLDSMPSTSSTAVQATLMSVGFSKLEGALRMGENSPLGRALRDKGWTIRVRGGRASPILMNPSGRCFKPDPRRVLVPLNSCG
jgi:hypothetical protein